MIARTELARRDGHLIVLQVGDVPAGIDAASVVAQQHFVAVGIELYVVDQSVRPGSSKSSALWPTESPTILDTGFVGYSADIACLHCSRAGGYTTSAAVDTANHQLARRSPTGVVGRGTAETREPGGSSDIADVLRAIRIPC